MERWKILKQAIELAKKRLFDQAKLDEDEYETLQDLSDKEAVEALAQIILGAAVDSFK